MPGPPSTDPSPSGSSDSSSTEADAYPPDFSETEQRIFDAALVEFARKGKDGGRMQSIADAAGINKAMLHYYFRRKDDLYASVFEHTMRRFMMSFGASLKEAPTFRKTLRAFIDGYVSFVRQNEHVMRLMVTENLAGGTLLAEHVQHMKMKDGAPPQVMVERIRTAVENDEIRPVDPDHTLLSIVSMCIFFFAMRPTVEFLHPDASDWDAFVSERVDQVFDLVYHGLEPCA
jgi:TetR/AcrR family transcriptional regulator